MIKSISQKKINSILPELKTINFTLNPFLPLVGGLSDLPWPSGDTALTTDGTTAPKKKKIETVMKKSLTFLGFQIKFATVHQS